MYHILVWHYCFEWNSCHYGDVILATIASQITSLTTVYSTVYSGADQRKHQSCVSLAFVWGIHRGPGKSPHKWPVTRKMFPFDDVIMCWRVPRMCYYPIIVFCSFHCFLLFFSGRRDDICIKPSGKILFLLRMVHDIHIFHKYIYRIYTQTYAALLHNLVATVLTYCGQVTHICVSKISHDWFR